MAPSPALRDRDEGDEAERKEREKKTNSMGRKRMT